MDVFCLAPFMAGCGAGAGLIIAIGAQNAFVLRQGILKNYVFITALICSLVDALLICLGVGGFGTILTSNAVLLASARWGGAVFLGYYGFRSFLWFFTLGYGAGYLAPLFQKPLSWKILDFLTGSLMWVIALSLILWAPNCLCD